MKLWITRCFTTRSHYTKHRITSWDQLDITIMSDKFIIMLSVYSERIREKIYQRSFEENGRGF